MELISSTYKALNRQMHKNPNFGRIGHRWVPQAVRICQENNFKTVLDYGCGKGTFKQSMPYETFEYDPGIEGKETPKKADLVVCTDVIEHIEPEFLDNVLEHIKSLGKRYLLVINTTPSDKILADGRNAHLIVEDHDWWRAKLREHFTFTELPSKVADLAVEAWT